MMDVKMKVRRSAGPGVFRLVVLAQNSGTGSIPSLAISCLTVGTSQFSLSANPT
jgi:hypothetical protein